MFYVGMFVVGWRFGEERRTVLAADGAG